MSSVAKHHFCLSCSFYQSIAQLSERSLPFRMYNLSHIFGLHADRGHCSLLLNTYTFAGWVTGSLYRIVTGIFFESHANHKYDLRSDETWMLNKAGNSFMQPMKVCHDWTTTDATDSCMPGCEIILAVTASWLISVFGFCLCGIRSWKSHVWWFSEMKLLLILFQRCCVGRTGPIPWPRRSYDFTVPDIFWSSVTEQFIFKH